MNQLHGVSVGRLGIQLTLPVSDSPMIAKFNSFSKAQFFVMRITKFADLLLPQSARVHKTLGF